MAKGVYESIFSRLLSRDIGPGDRITVDQIARQLGVSQTPVRQALTALETEGLVAKNHLAGYRASPLLTLGEFDDLFDVRLLLEPHAARLAAERGAGAWTEPMHCLEQDMATRAAQSGPMPYGIFARLDGELHDAIAAASNNG